MIRKLEAFCQMASGLADLSDAGFREGTVLHGNEELLKKVFIRKRVLMD